VNDLGDTAKEKLRRVRNTHGHLCVALLALNAAAPGLEDNPRASRYVAAITRRLNRIVPDFLDFDAATRMPKPTYDLR
jgi:hypothetical protein